jgi:hypothetical protein
VKDAARRMAVVPFEAMIAAFIVYSGVISLFNIGITTDALRAVLEPWFADAFSVTYLIAGASMLYGIARGRGGAESFGLVLVGMSVIVRSIALVWLLGLDATIINALVFNVLVLLTCAVRLRALFKGEAITKVQAT